jgi:GWxTD domain-containing protein
MAGGGTWTMWVRNDPSYKPDATFGGETGDFIQYGASNQADFISARRPKTAVQDVKAVYQRWLEEDVVYIITDEEKASFARLGTDDEREAFIQAFWQRRDENPGTRDNEFRREYYSRIAYANETFSFAEKKGWQTDRGRVYIMNGKPDEVRKEVDREIWIYSTTPTKPRYEFVDAAKRGDYRLVR